MGNLIGNLLGVSDKLPLKAGLGETYTASLDDGTSFYAEQVSVAPAVTRFLIAGPNDRFKLSGDFGVG
jgi:hypothetical protein